jgi:HEAT repeat protein
MSGDISRLARVSEDPSAFYDDPDPAIRRLAVSASAASVGSPAIRHRIEDLLANDPDETVRAAAAEVLAGAGTEAVGPLLAALDDPSPTVIEAVATGLGETEDPRAVEPLIELASRTDKLVTEAAVAALGAVGDERALPLLLQLVEVGSPQVRRRCVVALSVFEGEKVTAALQSAAGDRNPMVREAAEMVAGPEE